MGYADLYLGRPEYFFSGVEKARGKITVYGVPFDSTSSYRSGQREGPRAIRAASANIESNGYTLPDAYIEDVDLGDAGDVAVVHGDPEETLTRVARVVEDLSSNGIVPVGLGGEHLVTLGALRGVSARFGRPCLIVFDAHFDLREDYLGLRLSHASVFRRALEENLVSKIFYIGVRAWDVSERSFADDKAWIDYVASSTARLLGPRNVAARARSFLSDCDRLYITIDMDALDPSAAPGVANPEPGGLDMHMLLELVSELADDRIVGADVVEVAPPFDCSGVTSIAAAKIVQELILSLWGRIKSP